MNNLLTLSQLTKALPPAVRKRANQDLVDLVNNVSMDSEVRETYRDNILNYCNVMQTGKYKMNHYLDAVRYVTFKLLGDTNIRAYVKTFPDRYQKFLDNGTAESDIASYITSYNKNKLVNLIFEQTLVPTYVLNADMHQRALNVQAALMIDDTISPKVRSDAANSLLTHLKMPETTKIELDISVKEDKAINDLRASTLDLVAQQRKMIEAGAMTAKETAHSKLVIVEGESEIIDVN